MTAVGTSTGWQLAGEAPPTPAPSGWEGHGGERRAGGAGRAAASPLLLVSCAPSWSQGRRAPPPVQTLTVSREMAERRGSQHLKPKLVSREVPGGAVVRIWRLGRRGLGSAPRRGPEIPQAARRDPKMFLRILNHAFFPLVLNNTASSLSRVLLSHALSSPTALYVQLRRDDPAFLSLP